jgi:riboflavin kinase/FMN adenylyltransferase
MYLIRGQYNLNLFIKRHPRVELCGTIGNFDGFHLGHQSILQKIKSDAVEMDVKTIVFITEPHAAEYFAEKADPDKVPSRILPWIDKVKLLNDFGIDYVFILKFDKNLRAMSPESFIEDILDQVGLVSLTVGDDFRFGLNRAGDFHQLESWGRKKNVKITSTDTFKFLDEMVSSTRIRKALISDNFDLVESLLGRPYTFSGKVVHGHALGRTIGIPTANIWLPKQKLPISGVYAVKCKMDGVFLKGIANMGVRPTVGGTNPVLEVHLFEFNEDIYSKRIEVEFKKKIREEKKFKNLDMLKLQIQEDISLANKILKD